VQLSFAVVAVYQAQKRTRARACPSCSLARLLEAGLTTGPTLASHSLSRLFSLLVFAFLPPLRSPFALALPLSPGLCLLIFRFYGACAR